VDKKYVKLKEEKAEILRELRKYELGFILMYDYFDELSDESREEIDKELRKIGL
jgi:hypothetical protein